MANLGPQQVRQELAELAVFLCRRDWGLPRWLGILAFVLKNGDVEIEIEIQNTLHYILFFYTRSCIWQEGNKTVHFNPNYIYIQSLDMIELRFRFPLTNNLASKASHSLVLRLFAGARRKSLVYTHCSHMRLNFPEIWENRIF